MARKLSVQEYLNNFRKVHGKTYDYSLIQNIETSKTKFPVKCLEHGEFLINANNHTQGKGCPVCGNSRIAQARSKSSDAWLDACIDAHGFTYTYPDFPTIVNCRSVISVECPTHGTFKQNLTVHTQGSGCPECGKTLARFKSYAPPEIPRISDAQWIDRLTKTHNGMYSYEGNANIRSTSMLNIRCLKHGLFTQLANNHFRGAACPACANQQSAPERYLGAFIRSLGFEVTERYRPDWLRSTKGSKMELDIYVPEANLAIEYNGCVYHASEGGLHGNKHRHYHKDKFVLCKANGIRLISIYDFLWKADAIRYLHLITHALKLSERLMARKCKVVEISRPVAKAFLEANHFDGFGWAQADFKSYGLEYGNRLVMVLSRHNQYNQISKKKEPVIHRIATVRGLAVVGGVSRLLKAAGSARMLTTNDTGSVNPNSIVTPGTRYWWVNPKTLDFYPRNYCQKSKLEDHFGLKLGDGETETQYMVRAGFLRIDDSGLSAIPT